ncbi:MAG: L-lactate permease, partial [Limisphaerales bacterium]
MDVLVAIAPILLLIYLMAKKKSMPSGRALPLSALVLYVLQLTYFATDPNLLNAAVLQGLLTAFTPILIVWGAILLFRAMEYSGAMDVVRRWLNGITDNKVAQLMIVGWSFSFLIEGASGFGTPAALAAPLLVGLGFSPLPVAILCLVMNTVPVSFGAVGMPTWFGFAPLGLSEMELRELGFKTAIVHSVAALFIPIVALRFVVTFREIWANLVFILLAILASVLPYLWFASWNYEFPALAGGFVGLIGAVLLARFDVGLQKNLQGEHSSTEKIRFGTLLRAFFPLWGTLLLLLITRIPQLGLRGWLSSAEPARATQLGTLGEFRISPSLVMQLNNLLGTDLDWSHAILYVPSFLPFLLIAWLSFHVMRRSPGSAVPLETRSNDCMQAVQDAVRQVRKPLAAFLGALVFVKILTAGGENSSANLIGSAFASIMGNTWQYAAPLLGALGSFFSGSNTVSNLTFGGIQDSIAQNLTLNR